MLIHSVGSAVHYCTLEVEHADSRSSMSLLTYHELWEEDDRGGCSCDGRTLVHAGLPHLRNTSDTRTVDLSSTPVEMRSEESTTVEKEEEEYLCTSEPTLFQSPFQYYRFYFMN